MLVLAKELKQIDNFTFNVVWSDGRSDFFRLSHLQRNCPCSLCMEGGINVEEEVKAFRILSVGSYALRIEFSSGCSKGIFTFPFLRSLLLED
ncbi:MAG: DUF971 domain-containing protein [Chlamydiota bacterium]